MSDFVDRVISYALLRQGLPYVWGGKGLLCWTPTRPQPTPLVAGCSEAYDCIGIVTGSVHAAGGPDVRFDWSCQQAFDLLPKPVVGEEGRLRLYGPNAQRVVHVEIELSPKYLLGANGGDSTTTSYAAALKRGAKVRVSSASRGRSDFLDFRSLAAMQFFNPNKG